MKNITISKNALPKELADNYQVEERLDVIKTDTRGNISTISEYEEINEMLNTLIHTCEDSYKNHAKKELYDFIISLRMAKNCNL